MDKQTNTTFKLIRIPRVLELASLTSDSTVWNWVRDGKLPKPKKLSPRITVWYEHEIIEALEKMMDENTDKPCPLYLDT